MSFSKSLEIEEMDDDIGRETATPLNVPSHCRALGWIMATDPFCIFCLGHMLLYVEVILLFVLARSGFE